MVPSNDISEIAKAMVGVQAEVKMAVKNRTNTFFHNSKYADIEGFIVAAKEALQKYRVAVIQIPGCIADGKITLTTILLHESGQRLQGTLEIPLVKMDPQSLGSALTYGRRYAYAAMLGMAAEDDDGHAATHHEEDRAIPGGKPSTPPPQPNPQPLPKVATLTDSRGSSGVATLSNLPAQGKPLAEFIPRTGKYKDRKFSEISPEDIAGYITYMRNTEKVSGKKLDGPLADTIARMELYLLELRDAVPGHDAPPMTDADIPF